MYFCGMKNLEEKMLEAIEKARGLMYTNAPKASEACAEIAKNEAIEFAEWLDNDGWQQYRKSLWINYTILSYPTKTTEELFTLFKNRNI
jgi:hypothetical protein